MRRFSVLIAVLIVMGVLLSACGGSGGSGATAAVKSFFDAFSQLDFTKMKDVTCAAQKTSIDTMTGAMSAASSADQLKQMFKIDVSGLKYDEKAGSGGNIVVVSGKMTMSILGQSQDQTMNNQEIPMVNEGGQWKVCGAALPGQ